MSYLPPNRTRQNSSFQNRLNHNSTGQSFIEYALIIILFAIVFLSILLILGDHVRTFLNDLLQTWFPAQSESWIPSLLDLFT